jgi:hypothetical protein
LVFAAIEEQPATVATKATEMMTLKGERMLFTHSLLMKFGESNTQYDQARVLTAQFSGLRVCLSIGCYA